MLLISRRKNRYMARRTRVARLRECLVIFIVLKQPLLPTHSAFFKVIFLWSRRNQLPPPDPRTTCTDTVSCILNNGISSLCLDENFADFQHFSSYIMIFIINRFPTPFSKHLKKFRNINFKSIQLKDVHVFKTI